MFFLQPCIVYSNSTRKIIFSFCQWILALTPKFLAGLNWWQGADKRFFCVASMIHLITIRRDSNPLKEEKKNHVSLFLLLHCMKIQTIQQLKIVLNVVYTTNFHYQLVPSTLKKERQNNITWYIFHNDTVVQKIKSIEREKIQGHSSKVDMNTNHNLILYSILIKRSDGVKKHKTENS